MYSSQALGAFARRLSTFQSTNMAKIPRLLLFDIDGTLTQSHYKDSEKGHPMSQALSKVFAKDIRRQNIRFAGGTDGSIIREILRANGITEENTADYQEKVLETYRVLPGLMKKGVSEGNYSWSALPNVNAILERLSKLKDAQLALLTGNIIEDARIKLESASIDVSLFEIPLDQNGKREFLGSFGSDNEVRSKLVPVAQKRYSEYIGEPVSLEDMVIIGDSPKDVSCAHDNKIPCVAVMSATGYFTAEDLKDADYILKDGFSDLDESVKAIMETKYNN